MILGSHLSIAGGLDRAPKRAGEYGFNAVGLFVRNQRRWNAKALSDEEAQAFINARAANGIVVAVAHSSYLINLAGKPEVRAKSLAALADELDRCRQCHIEYLVMHPGSHEDEKTGIAMVADGLNECLTGCPTGPALLLETTSGAGKSLGGCFEQLAALLEALAPTDRFGVCLDTAHVFAAGYDIRTAEAYAETMRQFDSLIGLDQLRAIHVNDSMFAMGSRRDRHTHIGLGKIGLEGFAQLVRDPRLSDIPLILETPKEDNGNETDWDRVNAETLHRLAEQ
jgi:deoxyribonuclease-4